MTDFTRNYRRVNPNGRYTGRRPNSVYASPYVRLSNRSEYRRRPEKAIQASFDRVLPLAEAGVPEQQNVFGRLGQDKGDRNNEPYPMLADYRPVGLV